MNAKGMKSGIHYSHRGENRVSWKMTVEVGQTQRHVPARSESIGPRADLNAVKDRSRVYHSVKNKPSNSSVKG